MTTRRDITDITGSRRARASWAFVLACSLAACTVGPDYRAPETTLPPAWGELAHAGDADASEHPESVATPAPLLLDDWWTTFEDPTLTELIERAVRSNPDLRQAQARVREARALLGIADAGKYPTVDVGASYERRLDSENSFSSGPGGGGAHDLYRAGFDAAWELDLFGGVRRDVESASAELSAGIEDRRDVLVSLLAEVARNYVELRGAQQQATLARSNLQSQTDTLELTRLRLDAGLASELDVVRADAQAQTTAAVIPSFEAAQRRAIHALSVLLAQPPVALSDELAQAAPIPRAPAQVPMGLPSDLLRRRPDVRRAERQLASATARIGVATAELFPSFTLTGTLGLESMSFKSLGDADSRFWSIGPGVRWPLLDFGRVRNAIEVNNAREEQAFAFYEGTVLVSLREVEDALVSFSRQQLRRARLAGAVDSNQRATELATELYQQGQTDFLSVLEAQRNLFLSQAALVESESTVSTDLVALYKALGGGWEIEARVHMDDARGEAGARQVELTPQAMQAH